MESDQSGPATGSSDSNSDKLIPEWGESADNQIIYFALALIAAAALLGYGCTRLSGDNPAAEVLSGIETGNTDVDLSVVASAYGIRADHEDGEATLRGEVASEELRDEAGEAALAVEGIESVDNRLTIAEDGDSEAPTTTEVPEVVDPGSLSPEVDAAVAQFAGVNGSASLDSAILEGVVDTQSQSDEAESLALAVPGIESVQNRLRVLQPDVQTALAGAKVQSADAEVTDAVAIARGFVGNELEREAALNAAGSVPGISSVQDELIVVEPGVTQALSDAGVVNGLATVSTTDDGVIQAVLTGEVGSEEARAAAVAAAAAIPGVGDVVDMVEIVGPSADDVSESVNEIFEADPIQFASGSSTILDVSFVTLDEAVLALNAAPEDATFEVQGFTDVAGPTDANLRLSQSRADAVREYLIAQGVADGKLTAVGYGETQQFAPGTDAADLEANRRVQIAAN